MAKTLYYKNSGKWSKVDKPPSLSIGNVVKLPHDSVPYIKNTGTENNIILSFGIPQGNPGEASVASINYRGVYSATETYQKTDYIVYDGDGYVCNDTVTGETPNTSSKWDLMVLRGAKGDNGQSATITVGEVTSLPSGSPITITNSGTPNDVVLDFGFPPFSEQKGSYLPNGGMTNQILGKVSNKDSDVAWIEQKDQLPTHGNQGEFLSINRAGIPFWTPLSGSPTNYVGEVIYSLSPVAPEGCLAVGANFFQGDYPELYDLMPPQTIVNPQASPASFENFRVTEEYELTDRNSAVQKLDTNRYLINGRMLLEGTGTELGEGYNWDCIFNNQNAVAGANYSRTTLTTTSGSFQISWPDGSRYAPFMLRIKSYDANTNHYITNFNFYGWNEETDNWDDLWVNYSNITTSLLSFNITSYDPEKLYNRFKADIICKSNAGRMYMTAFKLYATDKPHQNIYNTKTIPQVTKITNTYPYVVAKIGNNLEERIAKLEEMLGEKENA